MKTEVSVDTVVQIVQSIFTTMMDLEVTTIDLPWQPTGERLTSSVYLEGDWNGAVSLECNGEQACRFAGQFLSMEPPDAVDDDVRDVLGEMANMIGGNIKSAMGMDIRLSMPSVIDGSNYELRVCGSEVKDRIGFSFVGGSFWVTVLGKEGLKPGTTSASDSSLVVM
jgi:chemotaxis protein CheX